MKKFKSGFTGTFKKSSKLMAPLLSVPNQIETMVFNVTKGLIPHIFAFREFVENAENAKAKNLRIYTHGFKGNSLSEYAEYYIFADDGNGYKSIDDLVNKTLLAQGGDRGVQGSGSNTAMNVLGKQRFLTDGYPTIQILTRDPKNPSKWFGVLGELLENENCYNVYELSKQTVDYIINTFKKTLLSKGHKNDNIDGFVVKNTTTFVMVKIGEGSKILQRRSKTKDNGFLMPVFVNQSPLCSVAYDKMTVDICTSIILQDQRIDEYVRYIFDDWLERTTSEKRKVNIEVKDFYQRGGTATKKEILEKILRVRKIKEIRKNVDIEETKQTLNFPNLTINANSEYNAITFKNVQLTMGALSFLSNGNSHQLETNGKDDAHAVGRNSHANKSSTQSTDLSVYIRVVDEALSPVYHKRVKVDPVMLDKNAISLLRKLGIIFPSKAESKIRPYLPNGEKHPYYDKYFDFLFKGKKLNFPRAEYSKKVAKLKDGWSIDVRPYIDIVITMDTTNTNAPSYKFTSPIFTVSDNRSLRSDVEQIFALLGEKLMSTKPADIEYCRKLQQWKKTFNQYIPKQPIDTGFVNFGTYKNKTKNGQFKFKYRMRYSNSKSKEAKLNKIHLGWGENKTITFNDVYFEDEFFNQLTGDVEINNEYLTLVPNKRRKGYYTLLVDPVTLSKQEKIVNPVDSTEFYELKQQGYSHNFQPYFELREINKNKDFGMVDCKLILHSVSITKPDTKKQPQKPLTTLGVSHFKDTYHTWRKLPEHMYGIYLGKRLYLNQQHPRLAPCKILKGSQTLCEKFHQYVYQKISKLCLSLNDDALAKIIKVEYVDANFTEDWFDEHDDIQDSQNYLYQKFINIIMANDRHINKILDEIEKKYNTIIESEDDNQNNNALSA